MIRSTGIFLQTSDLTAYYVARYRKRLDQGLLYLRDENDDLPILAEWKTARAFLARFKAAAPPFLNDQPAQLGKVWIEQLPGMSATPWTIEEDDYAQAHIRTRTPLIITPQSITLSGAEALVLAVGIVSVVEHRTLHSEINLSPYPRVHLIVDVKRPETDEADDS